MMFPVRCVVTSPLASTMVFMPVMAVLGSSRGLLGEGESISARGELGHKVRTSRSV